MRRSVKIAVVLVALALALLVAWNLASAAPSNCVCFLPPPPEQQATTYRVYWSVYPVYWSQVPPVEGAVIGAAVLVQDATCQTVAPDEWCGRYELPEPQPETVLYVLVTAENVAGESALGHGCIAP